jgi:hypothetical protein
MPLKQCKNKGGQSGWSWGDGPCLVGKDAKKKAIKMGIRIEGPDKFKAIMDKEKGKAKASEADWEPLYEAVIDEMVLYGPDALEDEFDEPHLEAARAYISAKQRKKIPSEDFGDPKGRRFPIRNARDAEAAFKLIGRIPSSEQPAIKARIKAICKRKNISIPDSWKDD